MFGFVSRLAGDSDHAAFDRSLRWLYGFVRPHRRAIAGLLGLALCASCLVLVQPWLVKTIIDKGLIGRDREVLVHTALAMVTLGVLATLLGGYNRYAYTRLSGKILFSLRSAVFGHLQLLPPSFYGRKRIGELMSRIDGDVAEIQRFAVDSLFSAITNVIGLLGALVFLLSLSWKLSLILLLLIPMEICWLRWMRAKVERQVRAMRESAADISSFLAERLAAMKFIQSSGQGARESERFSGLGERHMSRMLKLQVTEFGTQAVPGTLMSLSRAAAFLIGGYWVIEGSWQPGALIAFSTYMGMAVGPLQGLLGLYMAVQRMSVSLHRVRELCEEPAATRMVEKPLAAPACGALVLSGVWFSHAGERQAVLHELSAEVPYGSKVAISGASGVGKSTLIDLLERHYDPQRGQVLFAGVDLRKLDLAEWRRRIAVVSQDIVLLRGSLLYNLTYCSPHATRAQVERAVELARLDGFTRSLPDGLDTEIGERGQRLSGGQKQRIAIARALLQDPSVLVLDEATSAVDEATEQEVIAAIDRLFGRRTRILISHRPSTLLNADLHFDLVGGRLVQRQGAEAAP